MSVALKSRDELSDQEKDFLRHIRAGVPMHEAAELAGYKCHDAAAIVLRPAVTAALNNEIRANMQIGASAAALHFTRVHFGLETSTPVRADIGKALLDRTGHNVPSARPAPRFADADLSELSADELRRLVDGLERARGKTIDALADRAKPVHATLDATPDPMLLNLLD